MTERYGSYGVQSYRSSFDGANRVSSVNYRVSPAWNGTFRDARAYSYTYDSGNGSLTGMGLPANGSYTYSYDALQRLTGRTLKLNGSNFLTRSYSFVPGTGTNGTTMMVASMSTVKGNGSSLNSYNYSYDDVGNITAISGSTSASYSYDVLGQMLTETYGGKTYSYDYDEAGNIRSVSDGTTTHSYSYGDAQWKDLLTAYDGHAITYDAIGNPTSWHDGTTFTWDLGRRLMSAENTASGLDNSYTYDSDGLRLTKTVGAVQHKYVWQGGKLVSENWAGQELEFFYDESGSPYAFSYKSSATATPVMYYYVTNLQGDVVNILDASGNIKASYTYNAWGEILSATGDMAAVNPLRYRGYYFDTDTGLYYLQSRYYDPEICRFINADGYASTGQGILGTNMFAYCKNDPANYTDSAGDRGFKSVLAKALIKNLILDSIIHRKVQLQVSQDNPGVTYKNPMIIYNNGGRYKGGYGFCDLYNTETGEVWEVKKNTVDGESARKQLERYTKGRLNANLGLTLKVGTSPLILNSFETEVFGTVYQVNCYPDPDVQGLIRYNYSRSAKNDIKARQAFSSPAAETSFNGFPFLPFPGFPGFVF